MTLLTTDASVSVAEILDKTPGDSADIALEWGTHRRSYADLRVRAIALAGALQRAGLQRGDRVAVHLQNRGETFELYFACAFAGLTMVPVNFRLTVRELEFVLRDSGARILFTQESLAEGALAAATDVLAVVLGDDGSGPEYAAMAEGPASAIASPPSETHLLLFTSGTTGRPKGVRLTHMNLIWFAWQQLHYFGLNRSSVALVTAPTFNMAGINMFGIPTLLAGGTVVIQPSGGWHPEVLSGLVKRGRVTHTIIFPSQFKALLAADDAEALGFDSLRFAGTGGENCPPDLMKRFRERWPHVRLSVGYGQTETGMVSVCVDDDIDRYASSIGRVVVGTSCRIIGPDGHEARRGETGELFVRGPGVSPGYWNAPALTEASFIDGWFATGDLGHYNEDGLLYLTGRSKDVIISKAQNIYPAEIERVLMSHDHIADVAIIGVPDDEWGETVAAAVVRIPGSTLSEDDVVVCVREALASYKKPRHVVFVDALPRNGAGKVDRALLTERVVARVLD